MNTTLPWIGERPPKPRFRPRCPQCARPLTPLVERQYSTKRVERTQYRRVEVSPGAFTSAQVGTGEFDDVPDKLLGRVWRGLYGGYGHFCSLRCCEAYANHAVGLADVLRAATAYVELHTGNGTREQPPAWAVDPDGSFNAERIAAKARALLRGPK